MLREKIYFIAGVGTDIGKTFFLTKICEKLRAEKKFVSAIKPIASGFCDDDQNSDSAKILAVLGQDFSLENLQKISPWRFEEAASPHFAAENLGQKISFKEVEDFCRRAISVAKSRDEFLFIEAAGGLMTPISYEKTFLDLAAALQIPLLLLSANYLGAISHTLCAIEAAKNRQILVEKILINEDLPALQKASQNIAKTIENLSGFETLSLKNFLN